ncbi:sugar transporter [Actibacterium sp. D379-3]
MTQARAETLPFPAQPAPPALRRQSGLAGPARLRHRHLGLIVSFFLLVLLPMDATAYYLFRVAQDQYASRVGFSVRKEEAGSPIELLGGITELSGSSSSDTDILFEFIRSQQLVRQIDDRLDLATLYAAPGDPLFSLPADPTIEDLVNHWHRVVKVYYDSASGLIELRVLAFSPEDAQAIARAVFDESSAMINTLSAIARDDATRYAKEELDRAVARLKTARQTVTAFRSRTQIVDPNADIQGRMGLLANLQAQLAEAVIDLDLLRITTGGTGPGGHTKAAVGTRVLQAERRVAVIEQRIAAERRRFGGGADDGDAAYANLMAEYESLTVEMDFAQKSYLSALAAHEAARAQAQRQSRYLAAYVGPTRAERAEYPRRLTLLALVSVFLLIGWSILTLIYYSLRDRR